MRKFLIAAFAAMATSTVTLAPVAAAPLCDKLGFAGLLAKCNRGEPIDLLISDVVMPIMDGPTMVREARKTRPELPILFMSGYAEEQLRKSIDIDNVAFLPKPFSVQELSEAARKVLATR